MLVDVEFNGPCASLTDHYERHSQGVYLCLTHNFEHYFRDSNWNLCWPEFDYINSFPCYGVCDSPEQLLERMHRGIIEDDTKYVIALTPVFKKHQPPNGGWRWHKWGDYIGDYKPQYEYLYDEDIDVVYCYHIYKVE